MSKSQLGQFFTTNYEYILQTGPSDVSCVVEPFVGNGDLLILWAKIHQIGIPEYREIRY